MYLDKVIKKLSKLSKKGKIIATLSLVATLATAVKGCEGDEKKSVYLVDLTDKYQNEATLFVDENEKNEIEINTSNSDKLVAIVDIEKTKKGKMYHAILIDENGKMVPGYIDGKYLDDEATDAIEVTSDLLEECNVVGANGGLWLRDNTKIDHETKSAVLLPSGAYVANSSSDIASKDNSYMWKETIYFDGANLNHGYVVSDYLMNGDFNAISGQRYVIQNTDGLILRSKPSTTGEAIVNIGAENDIIMIPNASMESSIESDGNYNWYLVACNTPEGIKTGYILASKYDENGTVSFLVEKEKAEYNKVKKFVDTSKEGKNISLKVREKPGTDSKIITSLKNGTEIYTYKNEEKHTDESKKVDGHKWIKIYLSDGETGYVADEYLKNSNEYKKITKVVDTLEKKVELKVRKKPNKHAKVISKLKNGTEVEVLKKDWDASKKGKEKDGHKWVKVYLSDGKTGYVARDFLKEKETIKKQNRITKIVDTSVDEGVHLKLRDNPGLDGKVISKIENGTEIYTSLEFVQECESSSEIDNHKWIKIQLVNGKIGYVASEYLKDKYEVVNNDNNISDSVLGEEDLWRDDQNYWETDDNSNIDAADVNSNTDTNTNINTDTNGAVTIDFGIEGTADGYYGIDVKGIVGRSAFENLISNINNYNVGYEVGERNISTMTKPKYVMFKLGGTYYGKNHEKAVITEETLASQNNLAELTRICEKYQIPYGFYYYSQAITEEDIEIEANFINSALNTLGNSKYNVLPMVIDVEKGSEIDETRLSVNVKEKGKDYQTGIINSIMNRVREENNVDVILYSDFNTLNSCFNYNNLDELNKQNAWIVDPTSKHSNRLKQYYPEVVNNISMRQIALEGRVGEINLDVDFIDKDYFNELLKKNNLISKNDENGYSYVKRG